MIDWDEGGGGVQLLVFMGETQLYRGEIELMGVPPTRENPTVGIWNCRSEFEFAVANLNLP